MAVDDLLALIRNGPQGPEIGAFFDFDGTIIQGYSAHVLYEHRIRTREIGPREILRALRAGRGPMSEEEFEAFLVHGLTAWRGKPAGWLDDLSDLLYQEGVAAALFHEAWRIVKAHQRAGHTVVIASSATRPQIAKLAAELGIDDILCTELDVVDGALTGGLAGRTLWGAGKEAAVLAFAEQRGVDLARSHGYANGDEDIPFLSALGHPHPVNPQPELARLARDRNWPVLTFAPRAGRLDLVPRLRTAAMWGSLVGAGAAGLAVSALSKDRWRGVNLMTSTVGDLGAALGGISIEVTGEEHLWSHRPVVFLINHQSELVDLVVGASLVRERTTAVAKKEIKAMPVVGALMTWAQMAFIDRADSGQARAALGEAIDRLHDGISIVVAPEGTRSYSPAVGPFKKGGFHLAREAGVPIVPIVVRNTGQLMPRGRSVVTPGRVEVVVLPPISTEGWTVEDVDREAVALRERYVEILEDWPASAPSPAPGADLDHGS